MASTISTRVSSDQKRVTIFVNGRFDFSSQREFRDAYSSNGEGHSSYHVNLSGADYMDSSAMGMLLMLQKHVNGDRSRVVIEQASSEIEKILKIANFDKIFQFS
ncbi:MAG: STAS domain-containing protein [Gammaproteobacteria bacterium]